MHSNATRRRTCAMVDESLGLNTSSGRLDQKKEGKYFMNKWMDKDPRDPLNMCQFVHFQKLCMYRSKINHELVQSLETPLFYVLSYRRKLKFPILFCDTKLHMHTKIYLHLNCSTSASNLTVVVFMSFSQCFQQVTLYIISTGFLYVYKLIDIPTHIWACA